MATVQSHMEEAQVAPRHLVFPENDPRRQQRLVDVIAECMKASANRPKKRQDWSDDYHIEYYKWWIALTLLARQRPVLLEELKRTPRRRLGRLFREDLFEIAASVIEPICAEVPRPTGSGNDSR